MVTYLEERRNLMSAATIEICGSIMMAGVRLLPRRSDVAGGGATFIGSMHAGALVPGDHHYR